MKVGLSGGHDKQYLRPPPFQGIDQIETALGTQPEIQNGHLGVEGFDFG